MALIQRNNSYKTSSGGMETPDLRRKRADVSRRDGTTSNLIQMLLNLKVKNNSPVSDHPRLLSRKVVTG